ncbi:cell division protein FtsZ [Saprospiraceae bacterium]|jgi:cell division protein FtsZ|nr:cell division protein FtsZ [Saprospiraceae bacterium]MDB4505548.1 cell division protein FtsZ [Saprospiraceae bacterium]MDC3219630.1 cell division protein FtsZ [Saprospiraceae bacterium]MDG1435425.1 cell division protein FtsZ [Saprospiraceae bacterium]
MLFDLPKETSSIIKVIGVGGGGSNAVNHMFDLGIVGVDFAICNTDNQAMELSKVPTKIQLGPDLTEGLGAGSKPDIGRQACIESIDEIKNFLANGTKMLFVTAGMGGGTGTGAAPIIAKAAQEMDILTVGIVTLPFSFEGRRRSKQGVDGLDELKKNVDTLIVISNDKLRQIHGNLKLSQAFSEADDILSTAAKGIAEIITVPGYVNVDFEDVNTVMRGSGVAIMGTATSEGEDRAKLAVDEALNSPLLEENDIQGAQHILLNITSGNKEVTMDEIFEITEFVQEEAGFGTDLIWGNCYDESLGDQLSVTVIATGFEESQPTATKTGNAKIKIPLDSSDNTKKKNGIFEIGYDNGQSANTVEFDNVRSNYEQYQRQMGYSYEEPYVKSEDKERIKEERRKRLEFEALKREERLRNLSVKLNNPQTVNELENEPAYLRRKVNLDDVPHSNEVSNLSRLSITDDVEPEIRKENSYLHDRPD